MAWLAAQRASFVALQLGFTERCGLLRGSLAVQFATLLSLLPNLEDFIGLQPASLSEASDAQVHIINRAALRACSSVTSLRLVFTQWLPKLPGQTLLEQLHAELPRLVGSMTSLESLDLTVMVFPFQFSVGLEAFVSALTPVTCLHSLSLFISGGDTVSVLPSCITALADLQKVKLTGFRPLVCAPGWADLPKLETLHLCSCGVEGSADHAFPGIASLLSLSEIVFEDVSSLTHWPSGLWRLSQLRVLQHSMMDYGEMSERAGYTPPLAALPATWSQLQGLQDLNLGGQGYASFPTVIIQLTALTKLRLTGSCFTVLPAGSTALSSLVELALGHRMCVKPGDLDLTGLGLPVRISSAEKAEPPHLRCRL